MDVNRTRKAKETKGKSEKSETFSNRNLLNLHLNPLFQIEPLVT